jgi:hypothetical protein
MIIITIIDTYSSIIVYYYSWLQRSGGKPRIGKLRWPAMQRAVANKYIIMLTLKIHEIG